MQYTQILLVLTLLCSCGFSVPSLNLTTTITPLDSEAVSTETTDFLTSLENSNKTADDSSTQEPQALPLRVNDEEDAKQWLQDEHQVTVPPKPKPLTAKPFSKSRYPHFLKPVRNVLKSDASQRKPEFYSTIEPIGTTNIPKIMFYPSVQYSKRPDEKVTRRPEAAFYPTVVTPHVTRIPEMKYKVETPKVTRRPELLSYPAALQGASALNLNSPLRIQTSSSNLQPRVKKGDATTATFVPGPDGVKDPNLAYNAYLQPKNLLGHFTNQLQGHQGYPHQGHPQDYDHPQDHAHPQGHIHNQGHEDGRHHHTGDAKYQFVYRVQDHGHKPILNEHGKPVLGTGVTSDFGHSEARNGKRTWGRYFVKLPDGRVQTVRYWADHSGYHAEVLFSGQAHHPRPYHGHGGGGTSHTAGVQYRENTNAPEVVEHKHYYVPQQAALRHEPPPDFEDSRSEEPVQIQGSREISAQSHQ